MALCPRGCLVSVPDALLTYQLKTFFHILHFCGAMFIQFPGACMFLLSTSYSMPVECPGIFLHLDSVFDGCSEPMSLLWRDNTFRLILKRFHSMESFCTEVCIYQRFIHDYSCSCLHIRIYSYSKRPKNQGHRGPRHGHASVQLAWLH